MDGTRLSKSVRRITVIRTDAAGATTPVEVYRRTSKRKKGMRILRPFEKAARQVADAHGRAAASYSERHKASNAKKKNGWVRDLGTNMARAARKGSKAIKVTKLVT